jgi:hypothetical protein
MVIAFHYFLVKVEAFGILQPFLVSVLKSNFLSMGIALAVLIIHFGMEQAVHAIQDLYSQMELV